MCRTGIHQRLTVCQHVLCLALALVIAFGCGTLTGCRESPSKGTPVLVRPDQPRPQGAENVPQVLAKSEDSPNQTGIDAHLGIVIDCPTEWTAGNEVSIPISVNNDGDQPIDGLELRSELQFGLQDSISEGRMIIPVPSLPAKTTHHSVFNFVSSRPGVWYVKAAVYHRNELIKATTRTLYIREPIVQPEQKPTDDDKSLGPPLVDHPERLQRLHPEFPIWIDVEGRSVVMIGRVCQREAPLELFACLKNFKEHESVVSINTRAYIVHAGLLALGLESGRPVQFYPEYRPAEGPEIDIFVAWKDDEGKIHRLPAQQWVREVKTKQPMKYPWIFTGSQIVKDEDTGEQYYYADSTGELICVSNFPSAVLDLPIRSTDSNESLLFEAFTENIPPLGTPVTVILTPKNNQSAQGLPSTTAPESSPPTQKPATDTSDMPQVPVEQKGH